MWQIVDEKQRLQSLNNKIFCLCPTLTNQHWFTMCTIFLLCWLATPVKILFWSIWLANKLRKFVVYADDWRPGLGLLCQFSWHLYICAGDCLSLCDGWPKIRGQLMCFFWFPSVLRSWYFPFCSSYDLWGWDIYLM